jgi:hypothetical protein
MLWRVLLIGALLVLMNGCKKTGTGGGPVGGAIQGTRLAAQRVVTENEMRNVWTLIQYAPAENMPTAQQIITEIQQTAPETAKLIQEGKIVLTGTRSREHIWAWSKEPQTMGGDHIIVTASGVDRMNGKALQDRLEREKGR